MMAPDFVLEAEARRNGRRLICGIDEAGRGPWAGPVVAAAVVLDAERLPGELADLLDDSKALAAARREELFATLTDGAGDGIHAGVGIAQVAEIDSLNILQATLLAMGRAVEALAITPDHALVDGNQAPKLACPVETVVKGDGRSLSIAAASIIAKVTRDRLMAELAAECPGYGWERNAGYGTREHQEGLARLGVTIHHRRSFAPIRKLLEPVAEAG